MQSAAFPVFYKYFLFGSNLSSGSLFSLSPSLSQAHTVSFLTVLSAFLPSVYPITNPSNSTNLPKSTLSNVILPFLKK
jgi:hypothetical protein